MTFFFDHDSKSLTPQNINQLIVQPSSFGLDEEEEEEVGEVEEVADDLVFPWVKASSSCFLSCDVCIPSQLLSSASPFLDWASCCTDRMIWFNACSY